MDKCKECGKETESYDLHWYTDRYDSELVCGECYAKLMGGDHASMDRA